MNYQDENEDIDYLINDFKNKVENKANLIFYDIDEWLDIIDFFSIENYQKYKHLHPFGVRLPCPDTDGTARTFNCAKVLHIYL